jgi:hypothetical protein
MEDKTLLDEYVLNDVGKIWVGPHRSCRGRQWVFGQFDKNVLPSTMLMLERANLVPINRGNPIILSRAISKMVSKFYLRHSLLNKPHISLLSLDREYITKLYSFNSYDNVSSIALVIIIIIIMIVTK